MSHPEVYPALVTPSSRPGRFVHIHSVNYSLSQKVPYTSPAPTSPWRLQVRFQLRRPKDTSDSVLNVQLTILHASRPWTLSALTDFCPSCAFIANQHLQLTNECRSNTNAG